MPIEQHPIPQDIASYKFRLIGDMTLKQFLQLAGGIIIGVLIYASPLPFFFKYPLSGIFIFLGVGMAFVPIEGRPMDKWIIAFIKSIYSPTQYIWKDQADTASTIPTPQTPQQTPTPTSQTLQSTQPTNINRTPPPTPAPPKNTLPIPNTPQIANTITGLTLDQSEHILEGAIIEIKQKGLTIRATKSNKLGQFIFIRPLNNGTYIIKTEKDNYSFPSYSLNLHGNIISPLKLQAK